MSDVDGRGASLEFERGRRALYLRMGMILCLFLVLMDRPLSPAHSSVPSSSSTSKASSSSSKEEGSHILKGLFFDPALAAHINAFTPSIDFGHNVTGTYRALVNGRQRAVVHLRSTPIINIPSLQFVFGIAKLTSAEGEGKNGIFPLQGVLLSLSSEEGELTLMASPLYRQHFAIQVSHNLTRSSVNSNGSVSTIRIASNQTTSLPSAKINTSQALNISTRPSSPPSFTTGIRGLEGKMRLVAFSLDELDGNATDDRNNRNSLLGAQWGDFSSSSLLSFNEDLLLPPSFQSLLHPNAPPKTSSSCTFSAVMRASFADRSHLFLSPSSSGTSDNNVLASQLDGTFFAKDCPAAQFNVTAESSLHSAELLERKVHVYVTLALLLCVLQIAFFVVQLRHSALANTMAKISILSLSAGALLDSLLCCVHLMLCTAFQKFSAHFLAIAVLQMLLFSVFGMRAVVAVYQSRFAQDFASEGSVGLRRRLTLLHARFYLALFVITLLLYASNLSPLCLLLLYSVWLPQIIYNAVMGTRDALSHTYFIGTAVCRLLLPLYALGCPRSMFGIALDGLLYSPKSCMVLTLWTVVQIVVLLLQDALGPRFFVPKYMLPVRYDYYRPLSSIHPLGATASVAEVLEDGRARQLPECVICYCAVDGGERHMITPCDHVFHEHCLTRWMAVKLDCPVCRHAIPSIE